MKKLSLLIWLFLALISNTFTSYSQSPDYQYGQSMDVNIFPFLSNTSNKIQWLYIMSEFDSPVPAGEITTIYLKRADSNPDPNYFQNLTIKIGHIPTSMVTFPNTTYLTTEMEQVLLSSNYTTGSGGNQDDWVPFVLDQSFIYDGTSNLVVEISHTGFTNGFSLRHVQANTADRRIIGTTGDPVGSILANGVVDLGLDIAQCNITVDLGSDITICEGETVTLDAGNNGATYEWNDNSTNQTLEVNSAGTYYVTVSEGNCVATDTIEVTVDPAPVVDLGNDRNICDGETITLDAGNNGETYEWNDQSTNQTLEVNDTGEYYVIVTNSYGCSASDTINIYHFPLPSASGFEVNEQEDCTYAFNVIDAENTTEYEWDFGDGSAPVSGAIPTHTYTSSGTYTVTLTLKNDCDDEEILTTSITCDNGVNINELKENIFEIFPNPANNLINIVNTQNYKIENISIYDITGKKVMNVQSNNNNHQMINISELPNGMYHIHITTKDDRFIQKVHVLK